MVNQDAALRQASGQAFHNTSRFTLRPLRLRVDLGPANLAKLQASSSHLRMGAGKSAESEFGATAGASQNAQSELGATAAGATYEPDPDLRDAEHVPLLEEGGIRGFFEREVLPHVPDAHPSRQRRSVTGGVKCVRGSAH